MTKKTAIALTWWIPSARHRRTVRRALCTVPSPHPAHKLPYPVAEGGGCESLIVPRGFGHSGSGVISDLLSEYDDVTVFGGADPDGSGRFAGRDKANASSFEVDIFKMYGGVADLVSAFGESRVWARYKILNFIHAVESLYRDPGIPIYDDRFLQRSMEFVDSLVEERWISATAMYENRPFEMPVPPPDADRRMQNPLYGWKENPAVSYVPKRLTQDEYVALAHSYLHDIVHAIPSRRRLVLDQFLSLDMPLDLCERYVGPFKMVAVWRDPRDVFCTGAAHAMPWMPGEKKAFAAWYRNWGIDRLAALDDPRLLVVRFEDLVLDYEKSVAKVEKFLELDPSAHRRPKSAFDPERSKRNIGIHRAFPDRDAVEWIGRELKEYCFG